MDHHISCLPLVIADTAAIVQSCASHMPGNLADRPCRMRRELLPNDTCVSAYRERRITFPWGLVTL